MLTIDSAIEVIRHPGEPRELRDAPTKTGNARTMTLDPDTLNAIWELRREREPYGPWMFGVGPDLVPPDHIGWWWTRARKNSGIDMKWRLHDLRHWSATVSIGQGHDVRTVAGRLGHCNPAMTLRVYAHAFAAADQALATGHWRPASRRRLRRLARRDRRSMRQFPCCMTRRRCSTQAALR